MNMHTISKYQQAEKNLLETIKALPTLGLEG